VVVSHTYNAPCGGGEAAEGEGEDGGEVARAGHAARCQVPGARERAHLGGGPGGAGSTAATWPGAGREGTLRHRPSSLRPPGGVLEDTHRYNALSNTATGYLDHANFIFHSVQCTLPSYRILYEVGPKCIQLYMRSDI
jgi:hypothetical protein